MYTPETREGPSERFDRDETSIRSRALYEAPERAHRGSRGRRRGSWFSRVVATLVVLAGLGLVGYGVWTFLKPAPSAPMPEVMFDEGSPDTYVDDGEFQWDIDWSKPLVYVESLGIVSPLQQSGQDGRGYLELPDPPFSTWYDLSADLASPEGNSLIASHVDSGFGDLAPFGELHKIEKGAPVLVQGLDGVTREFKAESIAVYERQAIPDHLFETEGDKKLVLVTCSGPSIDDDDLPYYMYNLVVVADYVGEVDLPSEETAEASR